MFKQEVICFYVWILKYIPGKLGCKVRQLGLPIKIGKKSLIWDGTQIDYPSNLAIGDFTSINRGGVLNCGGGIKIGSNVLIGPNVTIYSQNHSFADIDVPIRLQGYDLKKVTISDDVWIASNVIILPGVFIGKGAVIAAGSVVTKNVEPYHIMAGNPAKKISLRSQC